MPPSSPPKNTVGNLRHDSTGCDVVNEWSLLTADSDHLRDDSQDELRDLFVIQTRRGHHKGANAGVQDRGDFELILADVLVLCDQDPLSLANGRQEVDILFASKLVEWPRVVAISLEPQRDASTQTLIDV
jgi:hypothetical protein